MDTENRVVGANLQGDEELMERSIRPRRFEDYVGQLQNNCRTFAA